MKKTLVLGIGNSVMSDDGFGVRVVRELTTRFASPDNVTILDGGTLGLDLLPYLENIDQLLLIDAVMADYPPGTLVTAEGDDIPPFFEKKLSPHQMGLTDLISVSELMGHRAEKMKLLGVVPQCIEMGVDLSPEIEAQIDKTVSKAVETLLEWGISLKPH